MKHGYLIDMDGVLYRGSELIPGAANAINVCLRLKPSERITVITDQETLETSAALVQEVRKVGAHGNKCRPLRSTGA